MSEESPVKPSSPGKRARRRRRPPTNIDEIRENSRLTRSAVQKLERGEAISEDEIIALFKSDNLSPDEQEGALSSIPNREELQLETSQLFVEKPEVIHGYLDFWVPDLESGMLAYFRDHPDQLYTMHPRKFEELVAAIFRNNGFTVQLTPATRDGGVDIIAVQHSVFTGETVNLVECKRYAPTQKIGIGIVQRLLGCVHERRATKGILVTTSFFTRDAQHVAQKSSHNLALNDYRALTGWLAALPVQTEGSSLA